MKRPRTKFHFSTERPIMFLMFGYNAGFIAAGGLRVLWAALYQITRIVQEKIGHRIAMALKSRAVSGRFYLTH